MSRKNVGRLGVMIDVSRNSVMSIESLKRYLTILSKMGYNCAMLYTEDTYEIEEEPYFGYMRARYSKAELKEIDAFCLSIGIELIPCIQTLAHLNAAVRWKTFPVDYSDILLTDDERTYELIERMFKTAAECFSSRYIHIGMDEAYMLGRGKYLDIHGYETANVCIRRHLDRVSEIGKRYGFKMLMWSDMFFREINNGRYYMGRAEMPQSVRDAVSPEVVPVYWDYYHFCEQDYENMLYNHKQLADEIWFAGGAWSWTGVVPHNRRSIESMKPAMAACKKYSIDNIFFTLWGDDGGECSHYAQLPVLLYLAEYLKGNCDEDKIKQKFRRIVGADFDDFMLLDLPNEIGETTANYPNPSKYMFYCDCFNGFLDYTVNREGAAIYASHAERLADAGKRTRKYRYLFDTEAKLCAVLAKKYDLGVRTRAAYRSGDREGLRSLANGDYKALVPLLRAYYSALRRQWFTENKQNGFEVQAEHIGGLIMRIESCRRALLDYADGKAERIEELEPEILPFPGAKEGKSMQYNDHLYTVTSNVMREGCLPW